MRRIIESTLVSLDGVIGDPQTWAVEYLDSAAEQDAVDRLVAAKTLATGVVVLTYQPSEIRR